MTIFFNAFGFAPAVTNVLGYALPAYFSIQALESSGTVDDKQWLTYWIVFSSFTLLESMFLRVIVYWVPYWSVAFVRAPRLVPCLFNPLLTLY